MTSRVQEQKTFRKKMLLSAKREIGFFLPVKHIYHPNQTRAPYEKKIYQPNVSDARAKDVSVHSSSPFRGERNTHTRKKKCSAAKSVRRKEKRKRYYLLPK